MNWKTKTIRISKQALNWIILFCLLLLFMLLLRTDWGSEQGEKILGIPKETLRQFASASSFILIGSLLVSLGAKFMIYPPAGLMLAGVGLVVLAIGGYYMYKLFNDSSSSSPALR